MCLTKVDKVYDEPLNEWKVGYKVVAIDEDGDMKAPYQYCYYNKNNTTHGLRKPEYPYLFGFFIWRTKIGAKENMRVGSMWSDYNYEVWQVKYRKITASGWCNTGEMKRAYSCDCALEMNFIKKVC